MRIQGKDISKQNSFSAVPIKGKCSKTSKDSASSKLRRKRKVKDERAVRRLHLIHEKDNYIFVRDIELLGVQGEKKKGDKRWNTFFSKKSQLLWFHFLMFYNIFVPLHMRLSVLTLTGNLRLISRIRNYKWRRSKYIFLLQQLLPQKSLFRVKCKGL